MPGAFAHITLVNIATGTNKLDSFELNNSTYDALLEQFEFCELGSVSPDYPYLAITKRHTKWADHIHLKQETKAILIAGIDAVKDIEDINEKQKVFAWLCGFVSHIVADTVIHPIIELKVGPYNENKKEHRICEMHQDSYIYQRLSLGPIGMGEHLKSGVAKCSNDYNNDEIDVSVRKVWERMLNVLDSQEYKLNKPEIDTWHERFIKIVNIVEESDKLFPLSRHIAVNEGLTYPSEDMIHTQYIEQLKVPDGTTMNYDDIFDKAIVEIGKSWKIIGDAVFNEGQEYQTFLGNWNLDNGRDTENNLVYWA